MEKTATDFMDITGYEGRYMINRNGDVKSLPKKIVNGVSSFLTKERILTHSVDVHGYHKIFLSNGNKGGTHFMIHRILAMTFIPNPENKPFVNHINGIKGDNRIENLEWCTQKENIAHAIRTGLTNQRGENAPWAKLSKADVIEIRKILATKGRPKYSEIGKQFNVHETMIGLIKRNERWAYI